MWAIEWLRPYIEGHRKFTVLTDHSALKWLENIKDPASRLAWWALKLQQRFDIVHKKGSQHYVPDALSRIYDEGLVTAFEEIKDARYLGMMDAVLNEPNMYET